MEIVIKPHNNKLLDFKELWSYRELFYFLVKRDISVRYKQTLLGIAWAVIQPLLTMVVFTIFFNGIAGISSGKIPYPVFSFIGLIFWNYFSSALIDVSSSLLTNQAIVTKVYFPRIIIPIYAAITPVVDFFFAFLVLFLLLYIYHVPVNVLGFLYVIPLLMISILITAGLGSMLAILNIKYRDIKYVLPFFIQLLLFIAPVIYSTNTVPKHFQFLLYFNPMTGVIEFFRASILHGYSLNLLGLVISIVIGVILFLLGSVIYLKNENNIADIV